TTARSWGSPVDVRDSTCNISSRGMSAGSGIAWGRSLHRAARPEYLGQRVGIVVERVGAGLRTALGPAPGQKLDDQGDRLEAGGQGVELVLGDRRDRGQAGLDPGGVAGLV